MIRLFVTYYYLSSSRLWNIDAKMMNSRTRKPEHSLMIMRSIDPASAQVPVNAFIPDFPDTLGAISELDSEFFFKKKVSCVAKIYS